MILIIFNVFLNPRLLISILSNGGILLFQKMKELLDYFIPTSFQHARNSIVGPRIQKAEGRSNIWYVHDKRHPLNWPTISHDDNFQRQQSARRHQRHRFALIAYLWCLHGYLNNSPDRGRIAVNTQRHNVDDPTHLQFVAPSPGPFSWVDG